MPSSIKPISEKLRQSIIQVCRDCFHWKGDIKGVFLNSGLSREMYDKYDLDENSKARIARLVLSDLQQLGGRGTQIEHRVVEELCRWDKPHRDAPNQEAGRQSLADLKAAAKEEQVLVNPESSALKARRLESEKFQQRLQKDKEKIQEIHRRFGSLARERYRSPREVQRRGYELEVILADLFEANEIDYRRAYRADHEQIDGSFFFRGFTYIVEAKWEKIAPTFNDMAGFKAKVDGKLDSVRGLFVAMAEFDSNVLEHLFAAARNSRNNLILMDRNDLLTILEGRMALRDALTSKIDAAEQQGQWWHPLYR